MTKRDHTQQEYIECQERPRILLIDLADDTVETLKSKGFNCVEGSFGSQVNIETSKESQLCLLNSRIPPNLHEYDIIVIDLADKPRIEYDPLEHQHTSVKSEQARFLLCKYPQTVFDPRARAASFRYASIEEFLEKQAVIIIFSAAKEEVLYAPVTLTRRGYQHDDKVVHDNYSFLPNPPRSDNRSGKDTKVIDEMSTDFRNFLEKYNNQLFYEITFEHRTQWNKKKQLEKSETFIPLIRSGDDKIVSFAEIRNDAHLLVFPQLKNKTDFLTELFESRLPAIVPTLFPYSTAFAWLKDEAYRLPNEKELLHEKARLEAEYQVQIQAIEQKLDKNHEKYVFLHNLLTETDSQLVKTVENYFRWLGFKEVINVDEEQEGPNEEDLQVVTEEGLLVVEVKGIGGTSTDSECSQISKIRRRREKARGAFDVFGLYIVNHERYKPPRIRQNPPFQGQQIEDAKNDERGLLTTYSLFKLYFHIEAGYITKEDAQKALLDYGLITFKPSNAVSIGQPTEIHHNNTVGIFVIENTPIKLQGEILISEGDDYTKTQIIGIQVNNEDVDEVSDGEIGLKFSTEITKGSEIWILK